LLVMDSKRQEAPGELEAVRAFVNTLDVNDQTDEFGSSAALIAWLADHGLVAASARASREDLAHALELRAALRTLLLAHTDREPVPAAAFETLDDAARRAPLRLRFDEHGSASLEPQAGGAAAALGRLLVIVHGAIADGTWQRLKACRDHSCEWAFYDHTKNRSGAWCTMEECGNRAKARSYRERHGATSGR
jgi:predicted RNA-binding Zn ribbon-like protein